MPLIDMPLEELRTYMGSSPCPDDIDKYWDDALAEMDRVEHNATFTKVDFPAKDLECYDLYFTGTKGARIYAKFVKPVNNIEEKIPAVLIFHGLSGGFNMWSSLFQQAYQGRCVAALDVRGQGGLSQDIGGVAGTTFSTPFTRGLDGDKHDLLMRDIFLDTALLAKIVMGLDYVDADRVAVTGGSQGGGLSLACAALVPRIKMCVPEYPYLSDYKRIWNMDLDIGAYEGLRYYFRMFDPRHEREEEIFEKLGYIDIQNIAKRIRAKVLMGTGLMDTTCPPSTQFAVFNKITSPKQVIIYPEFGHEVLRGHEDKKFEFLSNL